MMKTIKGIQTLATQDLRFISFLLVGTFLLTNCNKASVNRKYMSQRKSKVSVNINLKKQERSSIRTKNLEKWNCQRCTFLNTGNREKCEICYERRSKVNTKTLTVENSKNTKRISKYHQTCARPTEINTKDALVICFPGFTMPNSSTYKYSELLVKKLYQTKKYLHVRTFRDPSDSNLGPTDRTNQLRNLLPKTTRDVQVFKTGQSMGAPCAVDLAAPYDKVILLTALLGEFRPENIKKAIHLFTGKDLNENLLKFGMMIRNPVCSMLGLSLIKDKFGIPVNLKNTVNDLLDTEKFKNRRKMMKENKNIKYLIFSNPKDELLDMSITTSNNIEGSNIMQNVVTPMSEEEGKKYAKQSNVSPLTMQHMSPLISPKQRNFVCDIIINEITKDKNTQKN